MELQSERRVCVLSLLNGVVWEASFCVCASFIHSFHSRTFSLFRQTVFFFKYFYFSFELKPESSVWLNVDACRLSFDPSSEGVWYLFARFSVDLHLENDICIDGDALVTLYHAFFFLVRAMQIRIQIEIQWSVRPRSGNFLYFPYSWVSMWVCRFACRIRHGLWIVCCGWQYSM